MLDAAKLRLRPRELAGVLERAHDGLNWHAHALVEKYSPDQEAWARRRLGRLAEGADLHRLFAAPEMGTAEADGNLLVTVGLTRITNLITGGGAQAFNHAAAIVGVGAGSTTPVVGNTALTDDNTANAYYQQADASNPSVSAGVITCVATFASGNANFAWNEWCFAVGDGGTITAGDHLSAVTVSAPTMLNHMAQSLGTKSSGSWVLTATVTLA